MMKKYVLSLLTIVVSLVATDALARRGRVAARRATGVGVAPVRRTAVRRTTGVGVVRPVGVAPVRRAVRRDIIAEELEERDYEQELLETRQ